MAIGRGIKPMATPATRIQFKSDSNHSALDTLQPGWAVEIRTTPRWTN